jgi:hypothetical protein
MGRRRFLQLAATGVAGAVVPGRDDRPPRAPPADPDIRFLDREALEAVLRAPSLGALDTLSDR